MIGELIAGELTILSILNLLDLITTEIGLRFKHLVESNPRMLLLFELHVGTIVKVIISVLMILFAILLYKRSDELKERSNVRTMAKIIAAVIFVVIIQYAITVLHNIYLLTTH